jgi:D-glycerate 3-kinase
MYQQFIDEFIAQEDLPESYCDDIADWFLPLVPELVACRRRTPDKPLLIGVNGAQGTGKSTLAHLLTGLLQGMGQHAVALSLDDFYLTKAERTRLSQDIHPLLACRGVPGTHDVRLASQTLDKLLAAGPGDLVHLPGFDKGADDRLPESKWSLVSGPLDIIFFEGWCVGATPQADGELLMPMNTLEKTEDQDGRWRHFVNEALSLGYQSLFARLNLLLVLQAPDFEQVYAWRGHQELQMQRKRGDREIGFNALELVRFIQHFERLTRHCLHTLPVNADVVFYLDNDHRVTQRSSGLTHRL